MNSPKTFSLICLGCKVNDFEATYTREQLEQKYKFVDYRKELADIIVIYTCVVTNTAEAKDRKMISQAKRSNPNAIIAVVGCLPQVKAEELSLDSAIKIICGTYYKTKLVEMIDTYLKTGEKVISVGEPEKIRFENMLINRYSGKTRAYLKIQDGCEQFCAYCQIPYSRGKLRSADLESVVAEAKILSETSKEIVLTGIHTGKYNDGSHNLYDLLKNLVMIEGLERIRLSSIEINEITDDIIDLMKNNPKIARHLHIPLQAGSDHILSLMKRPYTICEYLKRVEYIREQIPGVSVSCDLIVGFPNESEQDFNETLDTLFKANFSFIHCFPYSRKSGTEADKMSGHIDERIKKERANKVLQISSVNLSRYSDEHIGNVLDVLIEENDENYSYGHSSEYLYIKIKGVYPKNSIIPVKVLGRNEILEGEYVTE